MRFIGRVALAGASIFALSSPAWAQDVPQHNRVPAAAEDDTSNPGDIVVTARRVEERLQDVPISITVFNQQQITDRNIVSGADLATYTPSLSSNNRMGGDSGSFALRGFTAETNTSPSVGVYFADVVAPRAQGSTNGGNGAGPGAFFDLQNVQVLKGPQGTLFGRNTTGGAILLVPRKPTDKLEGYVEGTVGSYALRRGQAVVNLPLSDTFRVRAGFDRNKRRGYYNNISGIGPDDFGDINYWAGRLSVVAELTPTLENYTIFSISRSDTNGSVVKVLDFLPVSVDPLQDNVGRDAFPALRAAQRAATRGNFYDVANGNPAADQRIRQWQIINTTTWMASDTLTLKNIASYSEYRMAQSGNIYGENGYQNGTALPYTAVAVIASPGFDNISQRTFTEELQLQGTAAAGRLKYQTGAYYEQSNPIGVQRTLAATNIACVDAGNLLCSDVLSRNGQPGGFVQQSSTQYWFRNIGLYAQGDFALTDQLSLTGGIRYTMDKVSGLGQALKYFFAPPPTVGGPIAVGCAQPSSQVRGGTSAQIFDDPTRCDYERTAKSHRPTWMVSLDYKPADEILLFAKYARGYRQGGINVANYGLETWGPEKVDTYEIGAKTSFARRGYFNVTAFYNDFRKQQIAVNTASCGALPAATRPFVPLCANIAPENIPSSAQGISSDASSRIWGIEADASISPFAGFLLDANYAYLNTTLKSFPALTTGDIPTGFFQLFPAGILNGPLAFSPKHKMSVTAAYTLPLDESIGRITVSGTFTYQTRFLGSTSSVPARQFLPSQRNVNLNLNWNSVAGQPLDLSVFVTNLTKEKFFTNYSGASFGWDAALLNEPRMFGVRARFRFGD